ncbi:glycosyltransferase family 1 protein [Coleofasciculus sp. FACHB-129]|uniref:glycosyltransferase family 4 protein n=1 Tax=Cyanophyceae TaxID=3028117 RepID=UPI0016851D99|nr:glycosyltransferase family 1 protein [Coleofasciculus sp. FACHB-129]MBD1895366.1 glycosyltransferase family 4 protein [Coleofasciculus sp. FACHB-129]
MVKNLHICLNMVGGSGWLGGVLYIQNLARAIATLPETEKANIKLTIAVHDKDINLIEPARGYVNQIYATSKWQRAYLKMCNFLAERISFIPLELLNPQKINFLYPAIAGTRSPYQWGGWIPDFQHYHLPNLFSPEEIAQRNRDQQQIAHAAPIIVLSSNMAQEDFKHLYPEAASRSVVMNFVSCPAPEWFELDPKLTQESYQLPDKFFLISNQFWKHKDHAVVIEALGLLKQQGLTPTVVCTGSATDYRNPDYYNYLLTRIEELGISEQVRLLGLITRVDQIQLMRRSLAVIQPSLFEGWSTVVEDARSLGKPMLLSDFPVHLEQNPPDSYFFERSNAEQLAALIDKSFTTLTPGPDVEKESLAKQDNVEKIKGYGRRFLEIVRSVV